MMTDIYGRLVSLLIAEAASPDGGAGLRLDEARDGETAWTDATGAKVLVFDAGVIGGGAAVEAHVRSAVGAHKKGVLHVVVAGGEDPTAGARRASPSWQIGRELVVHWVSPAGVYRRVAGRRPLKVVQRVAGRLAQAGAAPSPEDLQVAVARGAADRDLEERFRARLARTRPLLTFALAAVCVGVFVVEARMGDTETVATALRMGGLRGQNVFAGELDRLLTATFLHSGVAHLVANLLVLLSVGVFLERVLGSGRFLVLYILSALGGSVVSMLAHPDTVSVGASGAIWGLMGGSLGLWVGARKLLPPHIGSQVKRQMLGAIAINAVYSLQAGVDFAAHLGGGALGFGLVASGLMAVGMSGLAQDRPHRFGRGFAVAAIALALTAAGSLSVAMVRGNVFGPETPPALVRVVIPGLDASLLVPEPLAGSLHTEVQGGNRVKTYAMEGTPFAVEVIETVLADTVAPEALPRELDAFAKGIAQNAPPGATVTMTPHRTTLGDRPVVERVLAMKDSLTRHEWHYVIDDRILMVNIYTGPTATRAWTSLGPQIAESLRDETPQDTLDARRDGRARAACEAGAALGCMRVAVLAERRGGAGAAEQSRIHQEKACRAGLTGACK